MATSIVSLLLLCAPPMAGGIQDRSSLGVCCELFAARAGPISGSSRLSGEPVARAEVSVAALV